MVSPRPEAMNAPRASIAASSSSPSAVTRTLWPVDTPLLMTAMIDFASTGGDARSRFSSVSLERNPAAVRTNIAAGRACSPLGLRIVWSVVRIAGSASVTGVSGGRKRLGQQAQDVLTHDGADGGLVEADVQEGVRQADDVGCVERDRNGAVPVRPECDVLDADTLDGVGDRSSDPRRVLATAGGRPEPDTHEATRRRDPVEVRVGQVPCVVEDPADPGV